MTKSDPTSIGEILWRSVSVSRTQLREALERQRELPDEKLGTLLVTAGCLTAAELAEALELQRALRGSPKAASKAAERIVALAEQRHEAAKVPILPPVEDDDETDPGGGVRVASKSEQAVVEVPEREPQG